MNTRTIDRRMLLKLAAVTGLGASAGRAIAASGAIPIIVHRDAACGCCGAWVEHLRVSGLFSPTVRTHGDMGAVKQSLGVPSALASCHTAQVAGYVIEGHVPASDILKLVRTRPIGVAGIAVPGMPTGSPGMEVPGRSEAYSVLTFTHGGQTSVFARYQG